MLAKILRHTFAFFGSERIDAFALQMFIKVCRRSRYESVMNDGLWKTGREHEMVHNMVDRLFGLAMYDLNQYNYQWEYQYMSTLSFDNIFDWGFTISSLLPQVIDNWKEENILLQIKCEDQRTKIHLWIKDIEFQVLLALQLFDVKTEGYGKDHEEWFERYYRNYFQRVYSKGWELTFESTPCSEYDW